MAFEAGSPAEGGSVAHAVATTTTHPMINIRVMRDNACGMCLAKDAVRFSTIAARLPAAKVAQPKPLAIVLGACRHANVRLRTDCDADSADPRRLAVEET